MGAVARLALRYLVESLHAEPIAELDAREYFEVPTVEVYGGLLQAPAQRSDQLYGWRNPGKGPDLVLLPGERQPSSRGFHYCRDLMQRARELGVSRVVTFAALGTPIRPDRPPRVLAVASSVDLLEELRDLGVRPLEEGSIGGINGVLLAAANEAGIEGLCLLGEFPFFAQAIANPKASAAVLRVFSRWTGVQIDMTELDESARILEKSLLEHLRQLEQVATGAVEEEQQAATENGADSEFEAHVEDLFDAAIEDREKALELKAFLDREGRFKQYEDRFLDLFRQAG
jgi:proteasome assembly chaperone (PAC2) family protein